ncbi:MAG: VCBS repeat-containing protein, partial [Caldilineaceae bacterium]|nr:VCBS repeat-containing protein [Caldilineaceae bacterium]
QNEEIFLNDGTGTFTAAPGAFATSTRGWTYDLVAADLDGDGDIDLAATNEPLAEVNNEDGTHNTIYLNDGSGHFSVMPSAAFAEADYRPKLVTLDANGDGTDDILLPPLLLSQANSPACTALAYAGFDRVNAGSFNSFKALTAFDADGDGDEDLAGRKWLSGRYRNQLYLNDGTGAFSLVDAGQLDDNDSYTTVIVPLDADRDGDVDLVIGNGTWEYGSHDELYLNDGNGVYTLTDAGDFDDPAERTFALVAFDADNDGDTDLAVSGGGSEALYLNDGHAWFTPAPSGDFGSSSLTIVDLVAFDANGDGDDDLLAAPWYSSAVLHLNDGQGVFTATTPGDYLYADTLTPLDADGDGDMDFAAAREGGYGGYPNAIYLNNGRVAF